MGKSLEQFEAWWETHHPVYDMGNDTLGHYQNAKGAWKAALENALQNEFVTDAIYKELE